MLALLEKRRRGLVVVVLLLCLGLLMLKGHRLDYSFNGDELFSLAAGRAKTWSLLFRDWILPDTFPPLYPVLLKVWVALFGTSETAVRSLSVGFSVLSLIAAALLTKQNSVRSRLLTLLFLGSSPAFFIYSQYARSYSLMIFLSVVTTGTALLLRRPPASGPGGNRKWPLFVFYGSALLLGLSHYFGWLYAVLLLLRNLYDGALDRRRLRSLVVLMVMMAWPVVHVLSGSFADKTQRIGWIVRRPISGVLNGFTEAAFPLAPDISFPWAPGFSYPWPLVLYGLLAVVALYAVGSLHRLGRIVLARSSSSTRLQFQESHYLLTNTLLFLLIVMLVDLRTPFGVGRYFTVLLPSVAFFFGGLPDLLFPRQTRLQQLMTSVALALVILAQLMLSEREILMVKKPVSDYKALAMYLRSADVCDQGCYRQDTNYFFHDAVAEAPYFDGIDLRKTRLNDTFSIAGTLPFVGYHRDGLAHQLRASNPGAQCWEPPQRGAASAFVFIHPESSRSPQEKGLIPCRKASAP